MTDKTAEALRQCVTSIEDLLSPVKPGEPLNWGPTKRRAKEALATARAALDGAPAEQRPAPAERWDAATLAQIAAVNPGALPEWMPQPAPAGEALPDLLRRHGERFAGLSTAAVNLTSVEYRTLALDLLSAAQVIAASGAEIAESNALRDRMAGLLTRSAIALRGPPPPLTMYDWSDLPDRIAATMVALAATTKAARDTAHDAEAQRQRAEKAEAALAAAQAAASAVAVPDERAFEEFVEGLQAAGWRDFADAQHTGIRAFWQARSALAAPAAGVPNERPEAGTGADLDSATALVEQVELAANKGEALAAVLAYRKTIRRALLGPAATQPKEAP